MKTVAERLKIARELKEWTQAQLAIAAGVSTGTVGNIESGARQSPGSLPKLAKALGISHDWLADEEGEMKPKSYTLVAETGEYKIGQAKELSPEAKSLARLFDMLPEHDQVTRALAYSAATTALVPFVEQHTQPAKQAQPLGQKKQSA